MINYNAFDDDGMPSEEEFPYEHSGPCDEDLGLCQKCLEYDRFMAAVEDYDEGDDWETVRWEDDT
jgi:hypothetical protein